MVLDEEQQAKTSKAATEKGLRRSVKDGAQRSRTEEQFGEVTTGALKAKIPHGLGYNREHHPAVARSRKSSVSRATNKIGLATGYQKPSLCNRSARPGHESEDAGPVGEAVGPPEERDIEVEGEGEGEVLAASEATDTVGLAVAHPIQSNRHIASAEPVPNPEDKRDDGWRRLLWPAIIGLAVLIVAISLLVALVPRQGVKEDRPQEGKPIEQNITAGNASWPPEEFLFEMPTYTLIALRDPNSPQSKAYKWTLADPNLAEYTNHRSKWRVIQRFALATFYFATNGPHWHRNVGWLSYEVDECQWFWAPHPSRKTPCILDMNNSVPYGALWLRNNLLSGTLPPEIALMDRLQDLQVDDNPLKGTIPTQLYEHKTLHTIWIQRTGIGGTIPSEVGRMREAFTFFFSRSKIEGTLPTELGLLTKLYQFFANRALIQGTLPSELGLCSELRNIALDFSSLSGTFPHEIAQLPHLDRVFMAESGLSGTIPEMLWESPLRMVELNGNTLSGTLPSTIGGCSNLMRLDLRQNNLFGTIPSEVGTLQNLSEVWLSSNAISGSLPAELSGMTPNMTVFDLRDTDLSGVIPEEVCMAFDQSVLLFDCSASLCGCDCSCGS